MDDRGVGEEGVRGGWGGTSARARKLLRTVTVHLHCAPDSSSWNPAPRYFPMELSELKQRMQRMVPSLRGCVLEIERSACGKSGESM